jgi:hypothetical protein
MKQVCPKCGVCTGRIRCPKCGYSTDSDSYTPVPRKDDGDAGLSGEAVIGIFMIPVIGYFMGHILGAILGVVLLVLIFYFYSRQ